MTTGRWPLLLTLMLPLPVIAGVCWAAPAPEAPMSYAQITVQQTLIVRMPRQKAANPLRWKIKRGPKCIAMADVAGAAVVTNDAIDLVLRGGQRYRAQFSSQCPALDYYSGFYILPTDDGRICADRDIIRTRSGGQCEIQRFRKLILID